MADDVTIGALDPTVSYILSGLCFISIYSQFALENSSLS
jgi:hypothetical protein